MTRGSAAIGRAAERRLIRRYAPFSGAKSSWLLRLAYGHYLK